MQSGVSNDIRNLMRIVYPCVYCICVNIYMSFIYIILQYDTSFYGATNQCLATHKKIIFSGEEQQLRKHFGLQLMNWCLCWVRSNKSFCLGWEFGRGNTQWSGCDHCNPKKYGWLIEETCLQKSRNCPQFWHQRRCSIGRWWLGSLQCNFWRTFQGTLSAQCEHAWCTVWRGEKNASMFLWSSAWGASCNLWKRSNDWNLGFCAKSNETSMIHRMYGCWVFQFTWCFSHFWTKNPHIVSFFSTLPGKKSCQVSRHELFNGSNFGTMGLAGLCVNLFLVVMCLSKRQLAKDMLPPLKTNMTFWKMPIFNRKYIFKWWMFHCHVSFRGG